MLFLFDIQLAQLHLLKRLFFSVTKIISKSKEKINQTLFKIFRPVSPEMSEARHCGVCSYLNIPSAPILSFYNALLGSCYSDIKQRAFTACLYAVGKGRKGYGCCGREEMIAGAGFEYVRGVGPSEEVKGLLLDRSTHSSLCHCNGRKGMQEHQKIWCWEG